MKILCRLSLTALLTIPLWASTVVEVDFQQLSQTAHSVVGGRITKIEPDQDPQTGYIYSTVTMSVSEATPQQLAGREYQFRMLGGEIDGKSVYIADFPKFQVDQEVVLFLAGKTAGVFGPTVGLWQGVFFVESDQTGSQTVTDHLGRPILGIQNEKLLRGVKTSDGPPTASLAPESSSSGLPMKAFFEQVRSFRSR